MIQLNQICLHPSLKLHSDLSQQVDCDLLFCGSLSGFKAVLSEGDKVEFGS